MSLFLHRENVTPLKLPVLIFNRSRLFCSFLPNSLNRPGFVGEINLWENYGQIKKVFSRGKGTGGSIGS